MEPRRPHRSAPKAGRNDIDRVRSFVNQALDRWKIPGAATAIIAPDAEPFVEGFGVRQLGKSARVTPGTVFGVGSLSKAFTAASLGLLVDDGDTPAHNAIEERTFPDVGSSDDCQNRSHSRRAF